MDVLSLSPFHIHGVGPTYTMRLALSGVETIGEILELEDLGRLANESKIRITYHMITWYHGTWYYVETQMI